MSYVIVSDNSFFSMFRGWTKEYPDAVIFESFRYALKTFNEVCKDNPELKISLIQDYGIDGEEVLADNEDTLEIEFQKMEQRLRG